MIGKVADVEESRRRRRAGSQGDAGRQPEVHDVDRRRTSRRTSGPRRCSATSTSHSRRRTNLCCSASARQSVIRVSIGDHRVQHAVRDRGVHRGEGGSGQAQRDADRHSAGRRGVGRSVRPVDAFTATRSSPTSNPQMPQIRADTERLADLAGVYADASPRPVGRLGQRGRHSPHPERAPARPRHGVGGLDRSRQHWCRHLRARRPISASRCRRPHPHLATARLLQPEIFCMFRNYYEVAPKV